MAARRSAAWRIGPGGGVWFPGVFMLALVLGGLVPAGRALGGPAPGTSAANGTHAAASTPVAGEEIVEFRFAPPDGSTWIKHFEDTRLSPDPDAPTGQREQRTTVRTELVFQRDPAGGWLVSQTAYEGEITFNGEEITNPALAQNLNHPLKVHLTADGRAERIDGFRELERKYERNLAPEQFARLAKTYTAASMERMELGQWNRPLADLIGARVKTGEQWQVVDVASASGAMLLTTGVMRFDGWTELRGRRGYKVNYEYDTTEAAVTKAGDNFSRTLNRIPAEQQPTRSNIVLAGSVVRVIDPETGMVLYEHAQRSYDIPTETLDGPKVHYEDEQIVRLEPGDRAN